MAERVCELFLPGDSSDVHGSHPRAGPHDKFNVGLRGEWQNGLSAEAIYHYYGSVTYPAGQSFANLAQA